MRGNKGFSIVGVLIASVIGIIVVLGTSQMLSHLSISVKQIEDKSKNILFIQELFHHLKTGCSNTLRPYHNPTQPASPQAQLPVIPKGEKGAFYVIRDEKGREAIDLTIRQDGFFEKKFGFSTEGHLFFNFSCDASDSYNNNDCSCEKTKHDYTANPVCKKKWTLALVSQRESRGILLYKRNTSLDVTVAYNLTGSVSAPLDASHLFCDKVAVSGGSGNSNVNPDDIIDKIKEKFFHVTSIGEDAGATKSKKNVFVGNSAGKKTTGEQNTFLGHNAGGEGTNTSDDNVFIGANAGKKNTGQDNIFIGTNAGSENTTASENVFIGSDTGTRFSQPGSRNTFVGFQSGDRILGSNNIAIGYKAGGRNGYIVGSNNVLIGDNTRLIETGNRSNNILIGADIWTRDSNQLIIGKTGSDNWITGEIGTTELSVKGKKVCLQDGTNCPTSSRTLKKSIKPFKKFKQALDDILKTPLFTYKYKGKEYNPKKRMGIIAEELPKNLQIKEKGKASRPDWVSIYGSFWGAIKALYEIIQTDKEKTDLKIKALSGEIKELKLKLEETQRELKDLKEKGLE